MPHVDRPLPPYIQVLAHIRRQIHDGELQDDDRIPSTREISREWGISIATATKVLAGLKSEGLVKTIQGVGTIVSTHDTVSHGPRGRFETMRRTGKIYPPDEHAKIVSAELVDAPETVAEALHIRTGSRVIRRRRITYKGKTPVSASTSWFDGVLAPVAPLLLDAERLQQGTPGYIAEVTGRVPRSGRDQVSARTATETDMADLDVPDGTAVLCGRNWLYDADGIVIEYGEYVAIPKRWQAYEYELSG